MKHRNRYDGVDLRAIQFVRYHARRLAQRRSVPGMEVEDYEQDLVVDLLIRSHRFDPSRASYPTFADRIIRHRVAELTSAGKRKHLFECSLPDQAHPTLDEDPALGQRGELPAVEQVDMAVDLRRFVESLTPSLRRSCAWLLAENHRAQANALGLHRSTVYEAASKLRHLAVAVGLLQYLGPDSFGQRTVDNSYRPPIAPGSRVTTRPIRETARPSGFIDGARARLQFGEAGR
jgi:DNA-directed RNA polymerase specialized sigma24 family protein